MCAVYLHELKVNMIGRNYGRIWPPSVVGDIAGLKTFLSLLPVLLSMEIVKHDKLENCTQRCIDKVL